MILLLLTAAPSFAEDSESFRPYFRFANGDISSNWKVYDGWSFSFGTNLNLNLGAELALDTYERELQFQGETYAEIGSMHIIPQIRLRKPLLDHKLVPYVVGGAGISFLQSNDGKNTGELGKVDVDAETLTVTAGGGVDYFFADNVAINFEGKYFWTQPVNAIIRGEKKEIDFSDPMFSVGLRIFTRENRPRPFADSLPDPPGRGYMGLRLGGALLTDTGLTTGAKLQPEASSFGDVNQTGGFLFGWNFWPNWAWELAVDSHEMVVDVAGVGRVGEYGMGVAIPRVLCRMPLDNGRWVPYINAGLGITYAEINDQSAAAETYGVKGNGIYPTVAIGAGVEKFIVRNLSLLADVGWMYSWNHKIEIDNVSHRADFSALTFHLGFRVYLFER